MNSNNRQTADPLAYLNQIAPKKSRKMDFLNDKKIRIIAILIGAALITAVFIVIAGVVSKNDGGISSHLAAKLLSTEDTVDKATSILKNTELRALNSNLKIYLTDTNRDIKTILSDEGIIVSKISDEIKSAESNTEILATLEEARLNAIYDRIYANEMAYQLNTILTMMREIQTSTKNSDMRDFLTSAIKNLEPTQIQFANFNAVNS